MHFIVGLSQKNTSTGEIKSKIKKLTQSETFECVLDRLHLLFFRHRRVHPHVGVEAEVLPRRQSGDEQVLLCLQSDKRAWMIDYSGCLYVVTMV